MLQPALGQTVIHLEMKHSGEVGVRHSSRSSGKSRRSSRTPRDSHAELMRTVEDLKRKHQLWEQSYDIAEEPEASTATGSADATIAQASDAAWWPDDADSSIADEVGDATAGAAAEVGGEDEDDDEDEDADDGSQAVDEGSQATSRATRVSRAASRAASRASRASRASVAAESSAPTEKSGWSGASYQNGGW